MPDEPNEDWRPEPEEPEPQNALERLIQQAAVSALPRAIAITVPSARMETTPFMTSRMTSFCSYFKCLLLPLALAIPTLDVRAGATHELVASFGFPPQFPGSGTLVLGDDGYYWGTTVVGGDYDSRGTIYKVKADGSEWQTVLSFSGNGAVNKGSSPSGGLVNDGLGSLWGTTTYGGVLDVGTVFKLNMSTGVLTTLVEFTGDQVTNRGSYPNAALVSDGTGFLWGTTSSGGLDGLGTLFKINVSTGVLTTLVEFTGNGATHKGAGPQASLVNDGAGFFWGTTIYGGALDAGTVFKIDISTGVLTTLVEFTNNGAINKGAGPVAALVSDGAGSFLGTTTTGGVTGAGTVFRVNQTTGALTTLVVFSGNGPINKGAYSAAGLVSDGAGSFLGTTSSGGSTNNGTLFRINAENGGLTTLIEFTDNGASSKGAAPAASLVSDGMGSFFGTTQYGGQNGNGTVFKITPSTGAFMTMVDFSGTGTNKRGLYPKAGLVSDGVGSFWGTTQEGGSFGFGTVYKVSPTTGVHTTMVDFTGNGATNRGYFPFAGLVNDGAGYFWGTTAAYGPSGATGYGTVFKVNASTGALTTLVEFTDNGSSNKGAYPHAGLVSDGAGSFWGTTIGGGASGAGTVFKINTSTGTLTTIIEFTHDGPTNKGAYPYAELVSDGAGYFWGTCESGGANGFGTVFKINATTGVLTTLLEFSSSGGSNRGAYPHGRLLKDGAGYLWGTTNAGGNGNGTVFKINASTGMLTTMVEFNGDGATNRGSYPNAGLMSDGAGYFWGTTESGGTVGVGTVFKVNASTGVLTTQVEFTGAGSQANTGRYPGHGSLIKHSDGHLYGTTFGGGPGSSDPGGGTIFRIRLGATPVTLAASGLTTTTAVLNGSVNPNGTVSVAYFVYGTSPESLILSSTFTVATTPSAVAATITGLSPGTTYYYRLRADNTDQLQPQYGEIMSFTSRGPEIAVETSAGPIANGGSASLSPSVTGGTSNLVFTVRNTGTTDLILSGSPKVAVSGADAALFTVTALPVSPVVAGGSTTFNVRFSSISAGLKTAAITLPNDDSDEQPFGITLSARALSFTADTDGDGLNDASELQMAGLGFDWQVNQNAQVSSLFSSASGAGLYTTAQVQALNVGVPLIQKNPTTGAFTLTLGVEKSTNLSTFNPFPMTGPGTSTVINGAGKLEFQFTVPDNAAFFKVQAQ